MKRKAVQVASLALIHFVIGVAAFLWTFSVGSDVFEGRPVSWLGRHVARPVSDVLWFPAHPMVSAASRLGVRPAPLMEWIVLIGNSLLWGWLAAEGLTRLRAHLHQRRMAGGPSADAGRLK